MQYNNLVQVAPEANFVLQFGKNVRYFYISKIIEHSAINSCRSYDKFVEIIRHELYTYVHICMYECRYFA